MSSHQEHNLLQNTECDRKIKLSCRTSRTSQVWLAESSDGQLHPCLSVFGEWYRFFECILADRLSPTSKTTFVLILVPMAALKPWRNIFIVYCSRKIHIYSNVRNSTTVWTSSVSFYTFKREKVIKLRTIYFKMYVSTCSLLHNNLHL